MNAYIYLVLVDPGAVDGTGGVDHIGLAARAEGILGAFLGVKMSAYHIAFMCVYTYAMRKDYC